MATGGLDEKPGGGSLLLSCASILSKSYFDINSDSTDHIMIIGRQVVQKLRIRQFGLIIIILTYLRRGFMALAPSSSSLLVNGYFCPCDSFVSFVPFLICLFSYFDQEMKNRVIKKQVVLRKALAGGCSCSFSFYICLSL